MTLLCSDSEGPTNGDPTYVTSEEDRVTPPSDITGSSPAACNVPPGSSPDPGGSPTRSSLGPWHDPPGSSLDYHLTYTFDPPAADAHCTLQALQGKRAPTVEGRATTSAADPKSQ